MAGRYREAANLQAALMPAIDALFCEVNPIPIKAALRLSGLDVGHCRLPLTDPTPEHLELLKQMVGATVRTEPQENHTDPGSPLRLPKSLSLDRFSFGSGRFLNPGRSPAQQIL